MPYAPLLIPHGSSVTTTTTGGSSGAFGSGPFGGGVYGGGSDPTQVRTVNLTVDPPWVEVTFLALPAGCVTITVYRSAASRTYRLRGGIRVYAVGGVTIPDSEAPTGVAVTYRAEMFDADGISLGYTDTASTQLWDPRTWLHNPLEPGNATPVRLSLDTAAQVGVDTPGSVYLPPGSLGVWIGGNRPGLRTPVVFYTDTLAAFAAVQAMFGQPGTLGVPPVLCLRAGADLPVLLPRPFYAALTAVQAQPVNVAAGGQRIRWTAAGQEVQPPVPSIVQATYTLTDLDTAWQALTDLDGNYATLLDIDRDYTAAQAGTSGYGWGSGGYGVNPYGI